jgi:hypothetical protein
MFDYDSTQKKLEEILNQLLSYNYFADGWCETVINLIDWIDLWTHTMDSHFSPNLFKYANKSKYAIKDMHAENADNPPRSVLLLKHIQEDQYSVVQGGSLRNWEYADKLVCIQDCYGYITAKRIKEFLSRV